MKKLYLFPAILLTILIGFQSCSKQSPGEMVAAPSSAGVIKVTIAPNQTYQLLLDNSVSASVSKQASHSQLSQTELDSNTGLVIYKYIPAVNYTGTDEVVLSKIMAANGIRSVCGDLQGGNAITYNTSFTTLKINITDK